MQTKLQSIKSGGMLTGVLKWAGAIAVPIAVFAVFLLCQGVNPIETYANMITSTFGNSYGRGEVIIKSAPFILIAAATCLSSKAGLVNVGGEGQFALGALFSTAAAMFLVKDAPAVIGIAVMALAGIAGGMIWGGIAVGLKVKANMNETITTVILNYIAYELVSFMVYGPLKDPDSFNWPQTPEISEQLQLPSIVSGVNAGIIIAVIFAVAVWYVTKKTRWGYKLKVIGSNPLAAVHAGYNVGKTQVIAMLISGGMSGLAGMLEIAGVEMRLRQTTGSNYGYLGFLAAWMAWNNPLAAIITAFIMGFLFISGNVLEMSSGLPSSTVRILMSIVLLAILWKGKGDKK
ncbi:MAG: ABC transporter permease [Firmicutes bacterium]|nr:ABC transporter permease [Bacillota bacterium]